MVSKASDPAAIQMTSSHTKMPWMQKDMKEPRLLDSSSSFQCRLARWTQKGKMGFWKDRRSTKNPLKESSRILQRDPSTEKDPVEQQKNPECGCSCNDPFRDPIERILKEDPISRILKNLKSGNQPAKDPTRTAPRWRLIIPCICPTRVDPAPSWSCGPHGGTGVDPATLERSIHLLFLFYPVILPVCLGFRIQSQDCWRIFQEGVGSFGILSWFSGQFQDHWKWEPLRIG